MTKSRKAKGVSETPEAKFADHDDDIDFSDVPELDDAFFAKARLVTPVVKEAVSLRIDSDVLAAFRGQGPGYQTRMNAVLRSHAGLPGLRRSALRIYRDDGEIGVWLRTDEIEEFIGALEHCAALASELEEAANWKWLILALHNAAQGAFVCALRGEDTSGEAVFAGKQRRLADFKELYARVRKKNYLPHPFTLPQSGPRDVALDKLVSLRNDFAHFDPKGLSLELSGMPEIVRETADAIEYLALKHPTFWHHLSKSRVSRIRNALYGLREGVEEWWTRVNAR
jgi:uncharacterized protein (DUF4415 family)